MQRQCLTAKHPHSPCIAATSSHPIKFVVTAANVWACYHRPHAAVPVLGQRLGVGEVAYLADGPHVVAAAACCTKDIFVRVNIGAGHHRPGAAVPMQN